MTVDSSINMFEYCPGWLFIADAQGTLTHQSKALTERFGARMGADPSLASLVAIDDRAIVDEFLRALADSDEPQECVLRIPEPTAEGEAFTSVVCRARRAPSDALHGVLESCSPAAEESTEVRIERKLLRAVMNQLEMVLWVVDREGNFVFQDGKALATVGLSSGQFVGLNLFEIYTPDLCETVRRTLKGELSHSIAEVHGVHWESWTLPLNDDQGVPEYSVGLSMDVSAALRTELELKHQLQTIKDQQRAIHELSAPLIEVWDHVVTVPLVGAIDTPRADELIDRVLSHVTRSRARFAILDLTGADDLDTHTARHILRLLDSLGLLGVEGLLTGISPTVAQTMVQLEINLGSITTKRTLRDGLRYCMRSLNI